MIHKRRIIGCWAVTFAVGLTLSAPVSVRAQDAPSYGALAGEMLCPSFDEIAVALTNFNANTLPHEAKELRKQLGQFRNRLDLFAFAYPVGSGEDLFLKIRKDVDKGYERMGDFKDLFDAQRIELAEYDEEKGRWSSGIRPENVRYDDMEKVADRREKVLKWHAKFMESETLAVYRAYVCAPDPNAFHERDPDDLSRFFWGGDEGIVPRSDLSGIDNFRFLAAELLNRAIESYPSVMQLRDLEGETAEAFHDFRKRARSVVKVADDMELIPATNRRGEDLHDLMDDVSDGYGDLNDIILDLELAVEDDDRFEAEDLRKEIAEEWTKLREWQAEEDVLGQMKEYAALLSSLIAQP